MRRACHRELALLPLLGYLACLTRAEGGFLLMICVGLICFTRLCNTHLREVMNGRMRVSSFQTFRQWCECYICSRCVFRYMFVCEREGKAVITAA